MRYKIINVISGEEVDPAALIKELEERGKLSRLPLLFSGEFDDLKIAPEGEEWRAQGAVEQLEQWAVSEGIEPEDLDDLVHDFASNPASAINNGGRSAQLEFLLEQERGDIERVKAAIMARREPYYHPLSMDAHISNPDAEPEGGAS